MVESAHNTVLRSRRPICASLGPETRVDLKAAFDTLAAVATLADGDVIIAIETRRSGEFYMGSLEDASMDEMLPIGSVPDRQ